MNPDCEVGWRHGCRCVAGPSASQSIDSDSAMVLPGFRVIRAQTDRKIVRTAFV